MNFRYKLMRFMNGRNGIDRLFFLLFAVSFVLFAVNVFAKSLTIQIIIDVILFYAAFRVLSRNIEARRKEEHAVFAVVDKAKKKIETARQRSADKTHIYKKCPRCKAVLRLPRRKGRHQTACPKCGKQFKVTVFTEYKY